MTLLARLLTEDFAGRLRGLPEIPMRGYPDPERDPHPSVEDPEDDGRCEDCESLPSEPHAPTCRYYAPDPTEEWCDLCMQGYCTRCACDGHDDADN